DSRVALSVETDTRNAIGLVEYLVVYGTARITEGGAAGLLQQLAHTYLGPEVRFPPVDNPPPGYITHISVGRTALTACALDQCELQRELFAKIALRCHCHNLSAALPGQAGANTYASF